MAKAQKVPNQFGITERYRTVFALLRADNCSRQEGPMTDSTGLFLAAIALALGFWAGYSIRAHISHVRHRRAREGY